MAQTPASKDLQAVLDKIVDNKKIFGASFALKKDNWVWQGASGNFNINQSYFIASTTKLFTTALILKLQSEGKLRITDRITQYVSPSLLTGLHHIKGKDYTTSITIKNLLAHTSGLPDYFQDKGQEGRSLEDEVKSGIDQYFSFEQIIARTKAMEARFVPGEKGKAHYSDANFQLLGKIIENITDQSYAENCLQYIIRPLGMSQTYLYADITDTTPANLYFKNKQLLIPKAMTSFGADGGMVSTSGDMLVFIEAFFTGKLFPIEYIDDLKVWNKIFFPMKSGIGIHLFKLPMIFDPFGSVPAYIGHSGLSGALAYYCPEDNIYVVGTVNQIAHPDLSFRTMIQLTKKFKKYAIK